MLVIQRASLKISKLYDIWELVNPSLIFLNYFNFNCETERPF